MEADTGAHTGQPRHKQLTIVHLSAPLTSRTRSGPVGRHKFCKKHKPPHRLHASRERRPRAAILGPGVTSRKEAALPLAIINVTGTSAYCTDGETYAGEMGARGSHFLEPSAKVFAQTGSCAQQPPVLPTCLLFLNCILTLICSFLYFFYSLHSLFLTHSSN